jgi:putative transcriptional regulator
MTSLAPGLLLSMPQLLDPNFAKTVVLLCRHTEEGAFGLVLNRPDVISGRLTMGGPGGASFEGDLPVWLGGPVEPERSWVLVGPDRSASALLAEVTDHTLQIMDGLHLSASPEVLAAMLQPVQPPNLRLIVGYSGWSPGQLEAELEESSWLMSDVDPRFIFDTPPEAMWERAIRRLGVDPGALHMGRGVH